MSRRTDMAFRAPERANTLPVRFTDEILLDDTARTTATEHTTVHNRPRANVIIEEPSPPPPRLRRQRTDEELQQRLRLLEEAEAAKARSERRRSRARSRERSRSRARDRSRDNSRDSDHSYEVVSIYPGRPSHGATPHRRSSRRSSSHYATYVSSEESDSDTDHEPFDFVISPRTASLFSQDSTVVSVAQIDINAREKLSISHAASLAPELSYNILRADYSRLFTGISENCASLKAVKDVKNHPYSLYRWV